MRRLEFLAGKMFDKPLADLSSLVPSRLIDVLKRVKSRAVKLDAGPNGATARAQIAYERIAGQSEGATPLTPKPTLPSTARCS
jgi:hypothetical protein